MSRKFKVAVYESCEARYVGYPIDDVANLICEPLNSRPLRRDLL